MKGFFGFFNKRTVFAFLTVLLLLLVSCENCGIEYGSYLDEPFFASISGVVDGIEVKAEIYCDPTEHLSREIYEKLIVRFLSPASLEGLTVTLLSSGEGIVRLGDVVPEGESFDDIADPFLALCPSGEPSSVRKEENGEVTVIYKSSEKDLTYTFDKDGVVKNVKGVQNGREIDLTVGEIRGNR